MTTIQTYKNLLNEKLNEIIDKTKLLDEDTIRWKPSEVGWSIMEMLCHIEDFVNFWMKDLVNVIHHSSNQIGRALNDPGKVAAVENADKRSVYEVLQGLQSAKQNAINVLSNFNEAHLQIEARHLNPKFGMKPMTFLLDQFVLQHLSTHLLQLQRNLQEKNKGGGITFENRSE